MKNRSVKVLLLVIGVVVLSLSIVTPTWATPPFENIIQVWGAWSEFSNVQSSQPNSNFWISDYVENKYVRIGQTTLGTAIPFDSPLETWPYVLYTDFFEPPPSYSNSEGMFRIDGRVHFAEIYFHSMPMSEFFLPGTGIDSVDLNLIVGEDIHLTFPPITFEFQENSSGDLTIDWPNLPSQEFWFHDIKYDVGFEWGGEGPFVWGGTVYLNITKLPTKVPEPATMLLLGSGLIGLAGYGRRKFFKK